MNPTFLEIKEAALCAWKEAEGEGAGGTYDVLHVIRNRVASPDFPDTVHGVIYQKNAFSWTRESDPRHSVEPRPGDPVYAACLYQAPFVLAGDDDPTNGATYYANPKTLQKGCWFDRHIVHNLEYEECARSAHHIFYRRVRSSTS